MRAATSAWERPSSRRSEVSSPDTERRRSAISAEAREHGRVAALAHAIDYLTFDITWERPRRPGQQTPSAGNRAHRAGGPHRHEHPHHDHHRPHRSTPHPLHSVLVPTVIEEGNRGERAFDIFSLLLRERIVFLGQEVDDQVANLIISQMLFLEAQDPEKDIFLYINSPGGVAYAGMAIYDVMQHVEPDVSTICVGMGMSAAAMILARRRGREALRPPQRPHHDPPGLGRDPGRAVATWRSSCARCSRSPAACPRSSPTTAAVRSSRSPRTSTGTAS